VLNLRHAQAGRPVSLPLAALSRQVDTARGAGSAGPVFLDLRLPARQSAHPTPWSLPCLEQHIE
jgi:hypothetical protein